MNNKIFKPTNDMRKKKSQSQQDPLEQLRQAWEEHKEQVRSLPFLTDGELKKIYDDFCASHAEVPPLVLPEPLTRKRRRPWTWTQVLSAAVCLCASVWSAVLCGRLGYDRPMLVMLCAIAVGGVLLAVHCLYPQTSPLYRQYCRECGYGARLYASFGLRRMVPIGITALAVLLLAVLLPVGDGYYMTTVESSRLASVGSVGYLMERMV